MIDEKCLMIVIGMSVGIGGPFVLLHLFLSLAKIMKLERQSLRLLASLVFWVLVCACWVFSFDFISGFM